MQNTTASACREQRWWIILGQATDTLTNKLVTCLGQILANAHIHLSFVNGGSPGTGENEYIWYMKHMIHMIHTHKIVYIFAFFTWHSRTLHTSTPEMQKKIAWSKCIQPLPPQYTHRTLENFAHIQCHQAAALAKSLTPLSFAPTDSTSIPLWPNV